MAAPLHCWTTVQHSAAQCSTDQHASPLQQQQRLCTAGPEASRTCSLTVCPRLSVCRCAVHLRIWGTHPCPISSKHCSTPRVPMHVLPFTCGCDADRPRSASVVARMHCAIRRRSRAPDAAHPRRITSPSFGAPSGPYSTRSPPAAWLSSATRPTRSERNCRRLVRDTAIVDLCKHKQAPSVTGGRRETQWPHGCKRRRQPSRTRVGERKFEMVESTVGLPPPSSPRTAAAGAPIRFNSMYGAFVASWARS
jgi:hypothetical protein